MHLLSFSQQSFTMRLSFFHPHTLLRLAFFILPRRSNRHQFSLLAISNKTCQSYHKEGQESFHASIWCQSNHMGKQEGFISSTGYLWFCREINELSVSNSQCLLLHTWFWLWITFSSSPHHFWSNQVSKMKFGLIVKWYRGLWFFLIEKAGEEWEWIGTSLVMKV